ncbi:HGxxPAAW family protein [Pseudokineococcus basanitobsidens]|uniref:HGxxPAAW family protein n=1 Tax=Pseudokineococcus basanitobsidens TaxID=1926649 RepID=A0ABU8RI39_9ACTN
MAQHERTDGSGAREHVRHSEQDAGQQRGPVLPPHSEDHGHSTAAWTGVTICMVGALIASFGVALLTWWMFWAGLGVFALGPVVGRILSAKGYGAVKLEQSSDHPRDAPHDARGQGTQKAGGSGPESGTDTTAGTR